MIQRGQSGVAQYVLALLRAMLRRCSENGHTLNLFVLEKDAALFDFVGPLAQLTIVPEKFRPPIKNMLLAPHRPPEAGAKESFGCASHSKLPAAALVQALPGGRHHSRPGAVSR